MLVFYLIDNHVVIVSSESDKATVVKMIKLGASQIVVKPFDKQIFLNKIINLLEKI